VPELPEVETVRRTLEPALGATITAIWDSGLGLHQKRKPPRRRLAKLVGAKLVGLRRHGKYLLLDTNAEQTLLVHLGMTGRLCLHPRREPHGTHTHLVLELGARRDLRFVDPRRFGQVDVFPSADQHRHPALADLGPDALTTPIDPVALLAEAKTRRTSLKAFTLDQRVLAGVGNIYASEALWRAQLRPTTKTRRLTAAGATRLALAIREVIDNALANGGTTLSDFVDGTGTAGENADYLWVYDRAGKPCPRCAGAIKRSVLQGRATYFCPTCQTA
jgi:formamidopyrimidine-DNA glycosylase